MLQNIATSSSQALLRLVAPVARSILSQVDENAVTPLPQRSGFVAPDTTAQA